MRRALLGVAIAGAAVLLLVVLSSSDVRRSGSNEVAAASAAHRLGPGEQACQPEEIPSGTDAVAIAGSPSPGGGRSPRIAVTVNESGRPVAAGSTTASAPDGRPLAELDPAPEAGAARVCLRNRSAGRVALLGTDGVVALDYFSGREAWWRAAPTIAERFGFGKSGAIGAWAFWLALALVAAAWVAGWRAFADAGARS